MSANQIGLNKIAEYKPKAFFASDFPRETGEVVLAAGMFYPEGSVLGKVTASGKCTLAAAAASDGSQNLYGILAEDVDATDGDRTSIAYLTGCFAQQRLTYAAGNSADNFAAAGRTLSIFFKNAELQPDA